MWNATSIKMLEVKEIAFKISKTTEILSENRGALEWYLQLLTCTIEFLIGE